MSLSRTARISRLISDAARAGVCSNTSLLMRLGFVGHVAVVAMALAQILGEVSVAQLELLKIGVVVGEQALKQGGRRLGVAAATLLPVAPTDWYRVIQRLL